MSDFYMSKLIHVHKGVCHLSDDLVDVDVLLIISIAYNLLLLALCIKLYVSLLDN